MITKSVILSFNYQGILAGSFWDQPSAFGLPLGVVFMICMFFYFMNKRNAPARDLGICKIFPNHLQVYQKPCISDEYCNRLGTYLHECDWRNSDLQIDKDGEKFVVRFVVLEGLWEDGKFNELVWQCMCNEMKEDVFDGKIPNIVLCNDRWEIMRVVWGREMTSSEYAQAEAKLLNEEGQ